MPELRRREATLRAELDALDTDLHDAETYLKLTETLDAFRARLSANAENLTVEQRQEIVRLVVREVLLGDDDITVRHSIPRPDERTARRFATAFTASRRCASDQGRVRRARARCTAVTVTRSETSLDLLPERDRAADPAPDPRRVVAHRPRPRARAARACSRSSSTVPGPTPPPRCAKAWRRR